jgi:23S rRNA pseudoU1915 N3-methylase RlmH
VDRFDRLIASLAGAFEVAAEGMLNIVLAFLAGRQGILDAMGAIDEVAQALEEDSRDWVEDTLPEVYAEGMRTALTSENTPDVDPATLEQGVHDESLDLFIEELAEELARTTQNVSEQAKRQIREIGRQRLAASLDNGTNARDEAVRMEEQLREEGVKFVDRRGRKWGPRQYAEMVLRTHTIEVSNEGNLNTAAELGSPGVHVHDGGPGDVDEPCKVANGQYWSLRYARLNRTEHPNCRRAFSPLPSTWSGKLDRE